MNHSENIQRLFQQAYNRKEWLSQLRRFFPEISIFGQPKVVEDKQAVNFLHLGNAKIDDQTSLGIYEIKVGANTRLARNRVQLRRMVARQVSTQALSGALAVYVDDNSAQWRFSYIAITHSLSETGELERSQTPPKRFTYLFGKGAKVRTAVKRFDELPESPSLQDLQSVFAVEPLTKNFYDELYKWYEKARKEVIFPNDEKAENHTQISLIRLLTRLLFIWFLKEKHLINPDLFDKEKLQKLIHWNKPSSFYKAILQNLFFATLSTQISQRKFSSEKRGHRGRNKDFGNQYVFRYQELFQTPDKIQQYFDNTPFLNGGLFDCLDDKKRGLYVDGFSRTKKCQPTLINSLFFNQNDQNLGLIDLLGKYQFTVEESTPLDVEVALDPELLGKVFENLLATYKPETKEVARKAKRKATGSYYTPREIVSYMVDESLKQYFKQHACLKGKQIADLFIEGEHDLSDTKIKTVVTAIDSLKILDPAVGSGAFPMGILQRLVAILEKIDPENTYFKQQQLDKADEMPDESSHNASKEAIEQIFSQENQHNTYGKKLMLIENAIYGVDIQAVAIQICKLRFLISLIIEQKPNEDKANNYGIKALPNLETKFIIANSLLPLSETPDVEQLGLFDNDITELQTELSEVRHGYFTAKTLTIKQEKRNRDKEIRVEILTKLEDRGITLAVKESMQKVVDWDLYNQNAVADWFNPEWQFGVKEGFDIVLGNPPYIMEDDNKNAFDNLHAHSCYQGKADLWHLFTGSGLDFTKEKGALTYIAKNQWFCSSSASKMRKIIYQKSHLKKIVDFDTNMVFENANQQTMIFSLQKDKNNEEHNINYIKFNKKISINEIEEILNNSKDNKKSLMSNKKIPKNYSEVDNLTFSSPDNEAILNKIYDKKNFEFSSKKEITQGIIGGPDKAFIVKKSELSNFSLREKQYLKMFHTNTEKYLTNDVDKYIFYLSKNNFKNKSIENYPTINKKLLEYKHKLANRREVLNGSIEWFHLWWARDEKFFQKGNKLVWAKRTEGKKFTYTKQSMYGTANLFFIESSRINLKYTAALLNSNLMYFYMSERLKHMGNLLQIDKNQFMKIPLYKISDTAQQPFIELVDKIIEAKASNPDADTNKLEEELDKLVYKLYDLTDKEMTIIKEST